MPRVLILLLFLFGACGPARADLHDAVAGLGSRGFDDKAEAIEQIARSSDPQAAVILNALKNRELVEDRASQRIVLGKRGGDGWILSDPISGEALGTVGRRDARPVVINNRLRELIHNVHAVAALASANPLERRAAASQLMGNDDPVVLDALRERQREEDNPLVSGVIDTALNIAVLRNPDTELAVRLNAIDAVAGSLEPAVRNVLRDRFMQTDASSEKRAAQKALASIDVRAERYQMADTLFFGLSLGSVLLLAAIGLAITFGVMGVINMAHGELIMLGAYTTYMVQQTFPQGHEWSLLVAVPTAFLVSGFAGVLIERLVIRFLHGRPLETLLATFGVSLILQQAVRLIFSPLNRTVVTPDWMSGALQINPVFSLTFNRLYIIVFALAVFLILQLVLKRTRLGLQVRAVSQNRNTARGLGIRSERVNALTFGLGSGIAGVAGVALAQLTNVGPNLGQSYIIDSFMVVVFGGVGNLWGTLTAAFGLGIANKLIEPMAGAVLAKIAILVFIILFIQRKPRGLFPQRGRTAEE